MFDLHLYVSKFLKVSYLLVKLPSPSYLWHWNVGIGEWDTGKQAGTKRSLNNNITPVALLHLLHVVWLVIGSQCWTLIGPWRGSMTQVSHSPVIAPCRPRAIAAIRSGTTIYNLYWVFTIFYKYDTVPWPDKRPVKLVKVARRNVFK